mmetsp:Transcript_5860/g.18144  ORF Transcript_5860/g.18144 Transcript_5860/m.18144 type:complete len:412 (+) Transcript_5860:174-1409(+)
MACSRLRASNRSMSSGGSSFLRSRSASAALHSGHVTLAAPTARRASACLRMHCAQYQPWPQLSRTARQGGTSLQQMPQVSAWLLMRMARGLERGVIAAFMGERLGLHGQATISTSGCCCRCCGSAEQGVAGGRFNAAVVAPSTSTGASVWGRLRCDTDADAVSAASASSRDGGCASGLPSFCSGGGGSCRTPALACFLKPAAIAGHRAAASRHHALASRGSMGRAAAAAMPRTGGDDASVAPRAKPAVDEGEAPVLAAVPAGEPEIEALGNESSKELATGDAGAATVATATVTVAGATAAARAGVAACAGVAMTSSTAAAAGTSALGATAEEAATPEPASPIFRQALRLLTGLAGGSSALNSAGATPASATAAAPWLPLWLLSTAPAEAPASEELLREESHATASSKVLQC